MVLANEWLEENYSWVERRKITELVLNQKGLTGILDLSDFVNLEKLQCWDNQLTQLILPKKNELRALDCDYNQLTSLNLSHCLKLEWLRCFKNKLTELILPTNNRLENITVANNLLTFFDYTKLNPQILTELRLWNNNLEPTDLSVFSPLVNLTRLEIGDENRWVKKDWANKFFGSLKSLKSCNKLKNLRIGNTNIKEGLEYLPDSLEIFYYDSSRHYNFQVQEIAKEIETWGNDWKNLSRWKKQKFTLQEAEKWIIAGAKKNDHDFIAWLRDVKQETSQWVANYQTDYQILSDRFKKYGLCQECQQPHTGDQWCKPCNIKQASARILSLNQSNNPQINQFIQELQLSATEVNKFIEWIPYEQFNNLEYLAEGGFGKVYQARWAEGNIHHWNSKNNQWFREKEASQEKINYLKEEIEKNVIIFEESVDSIKKKLKNGKESEIYFLFRRIPNTKEKLFTELENIEEKLSEKIIDDLEVDKIYELQSKLISLRLELSEINHRKVVLKILANSQSNVFFLDEASKHKLIDDWFNNLVPFYGLSQDLDTGNYLMVMQYLPERDLRNYLKKNQQELREKLIKKEELEKEIKELGKKIEKILKPNHEKIENLLNQIRIDRINLENSINSTKNKLKSKINSANEQQWEEKLTYLFDNFPNKQEIFFKNLENIKHGFSEKLTKEEVNNFYKIKSELVSLDTNPKNSLILEHQKKKREIDNIHSEIDNLTNNKLSIRRKLNQLLHIAQGLKDIHQKNLVHRDFHAGNILKGVEQTSCLITDLGLCKSVNESSREEKIFGVMPYVAPEVLQGQSYTQASDIYSFGIVMAELLTGLPPYYDQKHDVNLGVEICQGLRPQFQIKIPQLLEELINRCWTNYPKQRPTAVELEKKLRNWQEEIDKKDSEFNEQLQKSEDHNRNLALEVRFPNYQIHYGAIYHSKLLPTQEITRVLQTTNLSTYSTLVNQSSTTLVLATKQIAQLLQDPTEQQQALDLEIKKLEKETGKSFTEEQKELIKKFTNASQEATKDKDNEEAKNDVEELEDELKKELKKTNFSREDVKKVIHHCERLIELVQQTKENQFEAQVEIPAK